MSFLLELIQYIIMKNIVSLNYFMKKTVHELLVCHVYDDEGTCKI